MNLTWLIAPILVFAVAYVLCRYLCFSTIGPSSLDKPNERSMHQIPVPRTGGIAIWAGLFVGILAGLPKLDGSSGYFSTMVWVFAALLSVASVSLWDDLRQVSPGIRLSVHTAAALAVVLGSGLSIRSITVPFLGVLNLGYADIPVSVMFLVWMSNLYNFMDGIDGFAGGMTVFGFGFIASIACLGGHDSYAWAASIVACAAVGFLIHNVPPAKIFMGDVGSVPLGFLSGVFTLWGTNKGLFDLRVPLLIFSPFILDATATLLRRLMQGHKPWEAHRQHYYQRLVLAGWSLRKTLFFSYFLMLACGVSAIAADRGKASLNWMIPIWLAIYAGIGFAIVRLERKQYSVLS